MQWKIPHPVHRFSTWANNHGHVGFEYETVEILMDIQEQNPTSFEAPENGLRNTKSLKSYGYDKIICDDAENGINGDVLEYEGNLFKCVSIVCKHNLPLAKFRADWTQIYSGSFTEFVEIKGNVYMGGVATGAEIIQLGEIDGE